MYTHNMRSFGLRERSMEVGVEKLTPKMIDTAKIYAANIFESSKIGMINPLSFTNYKPGMVQDDLRKVETQKLIHGSKEGLNVGNIAEAIVIDGISKGWLDKDTSIRKSSEYDDFFNHIDIIVGLQPKQGEGNVSYLGLGIDVTTDRFELSKKLKNIQIREDLKGGGRMKYFDIDGFKGEKSGLMEVVLYMHPDDLYGAVFKWNGMQDINNDSLEKAKRVKQFENLPLQIILLLQILAQLYNKENRNLTNKTLLNEVVNAKGKIVNIIQKKLGLLGINRDDLNKIKSNSRSLQMMTATLK